MAQYQDHGICGYSCIAQKAGLLALRTARKQSQVICHSNWTDITLLSDKDFLAEPWFNPGCCLFVVSVVAHGCPMLLRQTEK